MLSILVPIYNFDVVAFISELHQQAEATSSPFEILCYDDASDTPWKQINQQVAALSGVTYLELPENYGRSKIRNKLAQDAQYDYLLFVDCDSMTTSKNYIQNYLDHCVPDAVIYGGRCYRAEPPENQNQYLRWHYGVERETFTSEQRNAAPYRMFLTNNYLISKKLQRQYPFNEQLHGYGHEDTLLGHDLKNANISIVHIDNPLCHIGLESAQVYLKKTEEGLRNLQFIIQQGYADEDIKLYQYFQMMKRLFLSGLFRKWFLWRKPSITQNLLSSHPSLRKFDFYKLGILLEISA